MTKLRNNDHGFTLVELLVVIVGILAAVVVFAVGSITDRGEASAETADLRALEVAEQAVFARAGIHVSQQDLLDNQYIRTKSRDLKVCLRTSEIDSTDKVVNVGGVLQTFDDDWSTSYQVRAACEAGYTVAP